MFPTACQPSFQRRVSPVRPGDAETRIKELAPSLDSPALSAKFREYVRGGLPASSMSDGRGSAETPLPMSDRTDVQIRHDRLQAEQALRHAALALTEYMQIQTAYLTRPTTDTDKETELAKAGPKGSGVCSNLSCDHVCSGLANDRLRHGRCRPCYRVYTQTGKDRDARLQVTA